MKTILIPATLFSLALWSCASRHEVQGEVVSARVIKVDTIYRYDKTPQKQLTWVDDNQIEYVTYASMSSSLNLGSNVLVLVRR